MNMLVAFTILSQISPSDLNLPNQSANPGTTLPAIMTVVFGIVALLSVLFVAIGGIKYTLSAGDPQGIQKAKNTILYALVGLAIAVSSFTILSFVSGKIG